MRASRASSRSSSRLKQTTAGSPSPSLSHKTMKLPQIGYAPSDDSPRTGLLNRHSQSSTGPTGSGVGVCSMQGRRPYQEDEYALHPHLTADTHLFGLFDGHAGGKCSQYVSANLASVLLEDESFQSNLPQAIKRSFHSTNEAFLKIADKSKLHDGSTGIVAILRENKLLIANAGDCRAVVVSGNRTIQMSTDHKPTNPDESKRIASFGGCVVYCQGVARVNRILAVSRAFGNRTLRTVIRPDAELMARDLSESDDYLVMASDGLWDVLKNKDVADLCAGFGGSGGGGGASRRSPQYLADELVALALGRGSMDNVTCIVVALAEFRAGAGGNGGGGGGGSAEGVGMGARYDAQFPKYPDMSSGYPRYPDAQTANNNSQDEDVGDNSGQTYPCFIKKGRLMELPKQHSLGSVELNDFISRANTNSRSRANSNNVSSGAGGGGGYHPMMASTKDLSGMMEDDMTIVDDRPMTVADIYGAPSASGGARLSGISTTSSGSGSKGTFPAHIRSLRTHGISTSFGEGSSLGSLGNSPSGTSGLNGPLNGPGSGFNGTLNGTLNGSLNGPSSGAGGPGGPSGGQGTGALLPQQQFRVNRPMSLSSSQWHQNM